MDLPVSVRDLGEQLRGDREIVPDPALFSDPQVFGAERERIFQRSVMALDQGTRLSEEGRWVGCDAAPAPTLGTSEPGGGPQARAMVQLTRGKKRAVAGCCWGSRGGGFCSASSRNLPRRPTSK